MQPPTTDLLAVPGARIYHEVRGTGPPLLLIPTGNGDAGPYGPVANALAEHYTVITYDRRGFSRSPLTGPVDDGQRLETDVSDAHRLLDHLAGSAAHVLGGSSGAIIALALLARHPDQVRTLVAHEPPLASVLPDAAQWLEFYAGVYATYKRAGAKAAMEIFRARMGMNSPTLPPPSAQLPPRQLAEMLDRIRANQPGWYENEIRTYPAFVLDVAALKPVSARLILAGGSTSRADFPYRPNEVLADRVGTEIVDFPGGHVGYVTHPVEFADMLTRVLSARDT